MHRKWYSSWDPEVPRDFEPQKSFAEYFKETADQLPENIAITYYPIKSKNTQYLICEQRGTSLNNQITQPSNK